MFVGVVDIGPPSRTDPMKNAYKTMPMEIEPKKDTADLINEFEMTVKASELFSFLSLHPACRELFQLMGRITGRILSEKAIVELESLNFSKDYGSSFVKEIHCSNCDYQIGTFDITRRKPYAKKSHCDKCGQNIKEKIVDCFKIEPWHVMNLCIYGAKKGIFTPTQYVSCPWCLRFQKDLQSTRQTVRRRCPVCGESLQMKLDFELDREIRNIAGKKRGWWLEWYVWRSLRSKYGSQVTHNRMWRTSNGKKVEVDVILEKNNEKIAILCDTKTEPTFNQQNFHILSQVFNKLILITTQRKINDKIVDVGKEYFPRHVRVIKGPLIERALSKRL